MKGNAVSIVETNKRNERGRSEGCNFVTVSKKRTKKHCKKRGASNRHKKG
jgi:hypothetical protein